MIFVLGKELFSLATGFVKFCVRYFYQIFIFSPNDSPSKTIKNVFYFIEKALFIFEIFIIFSLTFHTFQIQKDKWKWNNL